MHSIGEKRIFFDVPALIFIGLLSVGYVLWGSNFAETHLLLLNAPLFVGELVLFVCLILFFLKSAFVKSAFSKWFYLWIGCFIFFIVAKTLYGYLNFGLLAFRHAALFYYFLFALLGYSFYKAEYFTPKACIILAIAIIFLMKHPSFNPSWFVTCFILSFILIKAYPSGILRTWMLITFFLFMPYRCLFNDSRMILAGNFVAIFYLFLSLYVISRLDTRVKLALAMACFLSLAFGFYNYADKTSARSIISFDRFVNDFTFYDAYVKQKMAHYQPAQLSGIRVFNPNKQGARLTKSRPGVNNRSGSILTTIGGKKDAPREDSIGLAGVTAGVTESTAQKREHKERSFDNLINNILFRLFIWRDIGMELAKEKPIFGFSFGKPFRSVSLEILGWGASDWSRDGWVAAHSSFLEIIYRSGVVGVAFILSLFIILYKMIKKFVQGRSMTGILLCGIIIDWFIAANFLLIFELPYTAIPLWTLCGMTFAYYQNFKIDFARG